MPTWVRRPPLLVALVALAGGLASCVRAPATIALPPPPVLFRDVAAESGIRFTQALPRKEALTILDATGAGCAFLDYDGDGRLDLFLAGNPRCALYRNRGNGRFEETSAAAGILRTGYWTGCATADYDRDGDVDLFVSGYQACALYRNEGDGRFTEVAAAAGLKSEGYQTSAVFGDGDRDGYPDLYICRYVRFGPGDPQHCAHPGTRLLRACGPDAYDPEIGVLYRNRGNGTFEDATRRLGLHTAHGKAWGAAFGDFDGNGWQDLAIANDEVPGDLFRNDGGRLTNVGVDSGFAYNRHGSVHGGMGVDFGDYDNDGRLDLVVTTFWQEGNALYRNEGDGLLSERGDAAGLAAPTRKRVGFGVRFFDADHDGLQDLFFANGHVQDIHAVDPEQGLPQLPQLFLNQNGQRFREISAEAGPAFSRPVPARGTALGDYDGDGDLDLLVSVLEGSPLLLRNDTAPSPGRNWLLVDVRTPQGSPALGARVTVEAAGRRQVREVQTGGSVLSASDPRVHFGLGAASRVERLTVEWPGGRRQELRGLEANRVHLVRPPS